VLRLATDAKDQGIEVGIPAGRLAVNRLGRDEEETAGARLDVLGLARAEFDRHRATDDVTYVTLAAW
jgi:hypothetical protein